MSDQKTAGTSGRNHRKISAEVEELHRRCGVYTKPEVVRRILDAVGWTVKADLAKSRLLEPASGDGAFVVEAARRLVESFSRRKIDLTSRTLAKCITAFELHSREAELAREQVAQTLRAAGVHHRTADACARSWVITGDFLLSKTPATAFTHTVGNPPYVRWSRIPTLLKDKYNRQISTQMSGGDLFLPFLDRALESLKRDGRCGFICSDRWRYMAFAEGFRKKWLPELRIDSERTVTATEAFQASVDSYPTILIASKVAPKPIRPAVKNLGQTLADLGCTVKVGPALGHTPAYVLNADETDVEPELLRTWIDGSEISEGRLTWTGRRVVLMHEPDGELLVLNQFPRLKARLRRFQKQLKRRSIVKNGALWYRPIDRVRGTDWARPKLLLPELATIPRVCIDRSGAVPSHGVYAIFAPDDNVTALYKRLANGKLAEALNGIAPRVKGNYVRCYRRFLLMIRV
jgi:tRNA1(Val) A37 N6-methylase TrmN6